MKLEMLDKMTASSFISKKDDYICNFSEFDLQCRLGISEQISNKDYLEFLSHQTLNWIDIEKDTVSKIFEELEDAYSPYEKYLEDNIRLIKTTGQEESDAAYTRNNIIYIPLSMIQWPYNELKD
ncbi:unnamed protein product [marine sediment metagenome]|uniref:Uncharacterized protein n=1 Tax=marine sediment metagenome TaxID=412755 RepID=X1DPU3_9ZZZZ